MTVSKARLARLLSVVVAVGALAARARSARAEGVPCLSRHVGEILSAKLGDHSLDGALPAGWKIDEVSVESDHIELDALDPLGRRSGVSLRLRVDPAVKTDGHGQWFAFVIDPGAGTLDDAGRRGLLELATRVDLAVPENEAHRLCAGPPHPQADGGPTRDEAPSMQRWQLPSWVAPAVGALEATALGAVLLRRRRKAAEAGNLERHPRLRPLDWLLLTLALAVFAGATAPAIPHDYCDLCYLFSLEEGRWVPQEWVHPLWVPLLGGYRAILGVFGFHGHMLVPVEVLNLTIALGGLGLLFELTRRVTRDAPIAVAAVLFMSTSESYWQASVRPTPYALAFTLVLGTMALLVSRESVPPRRYALAGAVAGLAMGLHASAMALAPAALVCAAREPDPARTRSSTVRRVAAFGCAMLASAVFCWSLFVARNHIGGEYLHHASFSATFGGVEQLPGTSIYSSHDPLRQVTDFTRNLLRRNGLLCAVGIALLLVLAVSIRRSSRRLTLVPQEQRLVTATWSNFVFIGAFFLINNTYNGFVFASLALVPVFLAMLAKRHRYWRLAFIGLAVVPAVILGTLASRGIRHADGYVTRDPLLTEVEFLGKELGPRDVLLTPGCAFPELYYLKPLNLVELRTTASEGDWCEFPHACVDGSLHDRVDWWTAHGSRVWLALGDDTSDFRGENNPDQHGNEKGTQIFWDPRLAPRDRAAHRSSFLAALEEAGLALDATKTSPRGEQYIELRAKQRASAGAPPDAAAFTAADLRAAFGDGDPALAVRARVLADRESALPDDPWHACDLMQLACEGNARIRGQELCRPVAGCNPCEATEVRR